MFNIGSLFQIVGSAAKYKIGMDLVKEQRKRADELKGEAAQVKAPALRSEFSEALKLSALRALTGMPDYGSYEEEIRQSGADALAAAKESSASGADYGYYASAALSEQNKNLRELRRQAGMYKGAALDAYGSTLWQVGSEQKQNEAIRREKQDQLYAAASALEDAATANAYKVKTGAIDQFTEAASAAAGSAMGGKADKLQFSGSNTSGLQFNYNSSGLQFQYPKLSVSVQGGAGVTMVNPQTGATVKVPFASVQFYQNQGYVIQ